MTQKTYWETSILGRACTLNRHSCKRDRTGEKRIRERSPPTPRNKKKRAVQQASTSPSCPGKKADLLCHVWEYLGNDVTKDRRLLDKRTVTVRSR